MLIPDLPAPAVTRDSTTIFAGLRLSGRPADGEFVRTENLSTDRYPLLAPRRLCRGRHALLRRRAHALDRPYRRQKAARRHGRVHLRVP